MKNHIGTIIIVMIMIIGIPVYSQSIPNINIKPLYRVVINNYNGNKALLNIFKETRGFSFQILDKTQQSDTAPQKDNVIKLQDVLKEKGMIASISTDQKELINTIIRNNDIQLGKQIVTPKLLNIKLPLTEAEPILGDDPFDE